MILARHHTGNDLISLSETDQNWHALPQDQWPSDGEVPLDHRYSMNIKGTYFQADTSRYCAYWTSSDDFCFRDSNDRVYRLFHRDGRGHTRPYGEVRAIVSPALTTAGAQRPGYLVFDLSVDGNTVVRFEYDGRLFRRLYQSDITAFSDRTLGSWDFFVGVVEAVDALDRAAKDQPQSMETETSSPHSASSDVLTSLFSGETCNRRGRWGRVDDLTEAHLIFEGETMPKSHGAKVKWVWLDHG